MNIADLKIDPVPEMRLAFRAARWMTILGVLYLLGLNLAGLLFIWFAGGVRERRNGFRIASLVLLIVQGSFGAMATLLYVPLQSWGLAPTVSILCVPISMSPWLIVIALGLMTAAHLLPAVWLLAPHTRIAFAQKSRNICPNCGYDLRATPDRCPECGRIMRSDAILPPDIPEGIQEDQ